MDQIQSINVLNLAKTKFITRAYRSEYLAARQIVSFFGRWGGIIGLMYVGIFNGYAALPYLMILLAISRIAATFIFIQVGKYTNDK